MTPSTERLDMVARSETSASLISYARVALLLVAGICILLAVNSTAALRETLLVAVLGGGAFITALVLWLNWRYKVYALALFCFLFSLGGMLSHDYSSHSDTVLGWIASHAFLLLFVYYGCGAWVIANQYALANSDGFQTEKNQFDKWKQLLNNPDHLQVVEFSTGTFWTGYWTYRILNAGGCWVVAQFKRGTKMLKSCHVYELRQVVFTRMPAGTWQIDIDPKGSRKKSFSEVALPPSFSAIGQVS